MLPERLARERVLRPDFTEAASLSSPFRPEMEFLGLSLFLSPRILDPKDLKLRVLPTVSDFDKDGPELKPGPDSSDVEEPVFLGVDVPELDFEGLLPMARGWDIYPMGSVYQERVVAMGTDMASTVGNLDAESEGIFVQLGRWSQLVR